MLEHSQAARDRGTLDEDQARLCVNSLYTYATLRVRGPRPQVEPPLYAGER